MEIWKRAAIKKIRIETPKGSLPAEDLHDFPLESKSGASLNDIAKKYSKLLKEDTEEDFVGSGKKDTGYTDNKLRFDLVLDVIEYKKYLAERAENAAKTGTRAEKLMEAIEAKENEDLLSKSAEELRAELAKLKK